MQKIEKKNVKHLNYMAQIDSVIPFLFFNILVNLHEFILGDRNPLQQYSSIHSIHFGLSSSIIALSIREFHSCILFFRSRCHSMSKSKYESMPPHDANIVRAFRKNLRFFQIIFTSLVSLRWLMLLALAHIMNCRKIIEAKFSFSFHSISLKRISYSFFRFHRLITNTAS